MLAGINITGATIEHTHIKLEPSKEDKWEKDKSNNGIIILMETVINKDNKGAKSEQKTALGNIYCLCLRNIPST